jgi:TolB protein
MIAFVTRREGGRFLIATKNLDGSGAEQPLSDGGREESPSFAPNSRWILYTTQTGGQDSLVAMTVDGRIKQRLSLPMGDIREPAWGPFPR